MKPYKRKRFKPGLICLAFVFAACGGNGQQAFDAMPVPSETTQPPGGMSQKLDADGLTKKQHENAMELKGKVFGELPIAGREDAFYCNLPENMTSWDALIPLCHDPLYDILYYVDYGGDSMIHAIRDGESEVVVELSGKRLFCRDGKLYFLLDTQTLGIAVDGAREGNVLSYDPVDGKVAVVLDKEFDSIAVYQDMIYCRNRTVASAYTYDTDYWFYFFDTEELVHLEKQEEISTSCEMQRYQQYYLSYIYGNYDRSQPVDYIEKFIEENGIDPSELSVPVGIQLCTWDGGETIALKGLGELPTAYYIKQDSIIWTEPDGVHIWDIPSGKEEQIAVECGYGSGILLDGIFYMRDGAFVNWADRTVGKNLITTSDGTVFSNLYEICTDGKELFAVVNESVRGVTPHLYRIRQMDKEELFADVSEKTRPIYEQSYRDCDGISYLYPMEGAK